MMKELFHTDEFKEELGIVRLMHWPDGLVLWVGGEIVYKTWKQGVFTAVAPPPAPVGLIERITAILDNPSTSLPQDIAAIRQAIAHASLEMALS